MTYSNQLNAAEQAAYDLWKLEEKRFVLLQFIIGEAAASKRVDNARCAWHSSVQALEEESSWYNR